MAGKTQKTDDNAVRWRKKIGEFVMKMVPMRQSVAFAIKYSLSLGLAVLFVLVYNEKNGYWSGLTIAISFTTERQATFSGANARASRTRYGNGVNLWYPRLFPVRKIRGFKVPASVAVGCFLLFANVWQDIWATGQAGGISAVIGTLFVLGRKYYRPR